MDAYVGQYCADLKKERLDSEREVLNAARGSLLKLQASDDAIKAAEVAELTLKLARLARSAGKLDEAITELCSLANVPCPTEPAIQVELGHTLCLKHREDPKAA